MVLLGCARNSMTDLSESARRLRNEFEEAEEKLRRAKAKRFYVSLLAIFTTVTVALFSDQPIVELTLISVAVIAWLHFLVENARWRLDKVARKIAVHSDDLTQT